MYVQICRALWNIPVSFIEKWDKWLEDNFDPGHYDPWRDKSVIPSVMRVSTFLPEHLREEFYKISTSNEAKCLR